MAEPLFRDISDTARWVAMYRAIEAERPDALFRDPFAHRLGGERGQRVLARLTRSRREVWAFVLRTHLLNGMIAAQVREGADAVVNLAAGLDARPYWMDLPASLRWYELDLPGILGDKQAALAAEVPRCRLERIPVDLADESARRAVFARIAAESRRVTVMCEGLLIYLERDQVASLARDLAAATSFHAWLIDLASPGLLRMLQRRWNETLDRASAPLRFGPPEGPPFFEPYGWHPVEVRSILKAAAAAGRLSFFMSLLAKLPDSSGAQGNRPWSAVVRLERTPRIS